MRTGMFTGPAPPDSSSSPHWQGPLLLPAASGISCRPRSHTQAHTHTHTHTQHAQARTHGQLLHACEANGLPKNTWRVKEGNRHSRSSSVWIATVRACALSASSFMERKRFSSLQKKNATLKQILMKTDRQRGRCAVTTCLVVILTDAVAAFAPSPHGGGALFASRLFPLASSRLCPSVGGVAEVVPVSLHRRSIVRPDLRAKMSGASEDTVPSEKSLALMPVLERVAFAAKKAVTESTGKGTESSGQGRYEVTSTYVTGSIVRSCTHMHT
jgi:hypothetical protein